MKTIVGHCPKCGAPIYVPTIWHGITAPPNEYSCDCIKRPRYEFVTTTLGYD